jgi:hypothetical protein
MPKVCFASNDVLAEATSCLLRLLSLGIVGYWPRGFILHNTDLDAVDVKKIRKLTMLDANSQK